MSKVTKLFKHPIMFFKDAVFNKQEPIKEVMPVENLFVVSNLSQLKNIQALILKYAIKDCILLIIYTKKNLKAPNDVFINASKSIFKYIQKVLIPNSSNNFNSVKKAIIIKKTYSSLLDKYKPKKLYILSYSHGYSLLCALAKQKEVSVNYVEEGLGSYNLKKECIKPTLKQIFKFSLFGVKDFLSWANGFNKAYVSFPEIFKKQFLADEYIYFFPKAMSDKNSIKMGDILYVDQKYGFEIEPYVKTIVEILNQISAQKSARVFIKLHPGDKLEKMDVFKENIKNYENLILFDDNLFSCEDIVSKTKLLALIGIASSSLIYSHLLDNKLEIFSISEWVLNKIPKTDKNSIVFKQVQKDYALLSQFSHIKTLWIMS